MKKFTAVLLLVIAAAVLVAGCAVKTKVDQPAAQKNQQAVKKGKGSPNVLLISIDTLRADQLGCYGQKITKTPGLDSFAKSAVLFENAFPTVPFTVPSVFSILTSKFPYGYTMGDNHVRIMGRRHKTIAQALKDKGYKTVGISGSHVIHAKSGFAAGFDKFVDSGDKTMLPSGDTANSAKEELTRLAGEGGRFFMWAHFMDPHGPFTPPKEFDVYKDIKDDPLVKETKSWSDKFRKSPLKGMDDMGYGDSLEVKYPPAYRGEVSYTDHCVSLVLARLDELGLSGNTMVIITADHGTTFGSHDLFAGYSYTLYQDVVWVPLMIRMPGGPAGARVADPVSLLDIMPTILEAAGAGDDTLKLQGESLVSALKGQPLKNPKRIVYTQTNAFTDKKDVAQRRRLFRNKTAHRHAIPLTDGQWTMAVKSGFKLIRIPTPSGEEFELYNLNKDRDEKRNIVETQEALAKNLKSGIERFIRKGVPAAKKAAPGKETPENEVKDKDNLKRIKSLDYMQ